MPCWSGKGFPYIQQNFSIIVQVRKSSSWISVREDLLGSSTCIYHVRDIWKSGLVNKVRLTNYRKDITEHFTQEFISCTLSIVLFCPQART